MVDQHALEVVEDVLLYLLLSTSLLVPLIVGQIQGLDEAHVVLRLMSPAYLAVHHTTDVLLVGAIHLPQSLQVRTTLHMPEVR